MVGCFSNKIMQFRLYKCQNCKRMAQTYCETNVKTEKIMVEINRHENFV